MTDVERRGLIVARHRREVVVEDAAGRSWQGLLRGRRLRPLTGDEVIFRIAPDDTAVVETLLPRRTVLERIDSRGRPEGIAANVSLLMVVAAWRMLVTGAAPPRALSAATRHPGGAGHLGPRAPRVAEGWPAH